MSTIAVPKKAPRHRLRARPSGNGLEWHQNDVAAEIVDTDGGQCLVIGAWIGGAWNHYVIAVEDGTILGTGRSYEYKGESLAEAENAARKRGRGL